MIFSLEKIRLELKVSWKISRNESLFKENFVLKSGKYQSEIAPNIRYGETPERIEAEFQELCSMPTSFDLGWCHSFKNAVSNLRLKTKAHGDVFGYLNLTKLDHVQTSFSIPIMEQGEIKDYLAQNSQYDIYKLKVSGPSAFSLLAEVCKHTDKLIRVDANEGFTSLEQYLEFETKIMNFNIQFIEQPFSSSMTYEYEKLLPISKFEIIADESMEDDFDGELFSKMFHGINVKLMKAGGIENAKRLLDKARAHGLKTMVGCMIESSLGISEAYHLAGLCDYCDLDGALLIKKDPFSKLISYENGSVILN